MDTPDTQLKTLLELDARHDDLLERLEELDKRVEQVLAECLAGRPSDSVSAVEAARLVDRPPQP